MDGRSGPDEQRPSSVSDGDDAPNYFTILFSDADAAVAREASAALVDQGLVLATDGSGCDTAVVLLSHVATMDPGWRDGVETSQWSRVVPIRIGAVDDELVPKRLREINWVYLDERSRATTWASIAAVIRSKASLRGVAGQVSREAEAWALAGHPEEMLISDRRRADTVAAALAELDKDSLLRPNRLTMEYVARSVTYSSERRRNAVHRRLILLGYVLLMVLAIVVTVLVVRELFRIRSAAAPAQFDVTTLNALPDWVAIESVSVLVTGAAEEQALARELIRGRLQVPWSSGYIVVGNRGISAMKPLSRSDNTSVLTQDPQASNSAFAIHNVRTGAQIWSVNLEGLFWTIDVTSDEAVAVVSGSGGIALIDLRSHSARMLMDKDVNPLLTRITNQGDIVMGTRDGKLLHTSIHDAELSEVGRYENVIDVRAASDGTVRALVSDGPGHYALLDAISGNVLAEASVDKPFFHAGAVATDEQTAVVVGGDNQLWSIGAGKKEPRPTGIAVPDRTLTMVALSDGRYAIDGQAQHARVVHIDSGIVLGSVCTQVPPRLFTIEPSVTGERIACVGAVINDTWDTPDGPAPGPLIVASDSTTHVRRGVRVEARRNQVRVRRGYDDSDRQAGWWSPFRGDVTAVALSDDATRAIVASDLGEVAIIDATGAESQALINWRTPDRAGVVAVSWDPDPLVASAAGLVWKAPDCRDCTHDAGLIATVRQRLSGCWTDRQLTFVDQITRDLLDLHSCAAEPGPR